MNMIIAPPAPVARCGVFRQDRFKNFEVLLLQRAAHDFAPLLWEVPGGTWEPEDQTIETTVRRELTEETGLTIVNMRKTRIELPSSFGKNMTFFVTAWNGEPITLSDEHVNYVWCRLPVSQSTYPTTRSTSHFLSKLKQQLPAA